MKKFLMFFLVVILTAGFAAAEDIGLSTSLEFGIAGVNKPNDDEDIYPYLWTDVVYENAFLDEALDLYAELAYDFTFTKDTNDEGKEAFPQNLYLDFMAGYNFSLGDASTLSIILEDEDYFVLSPSDDDNIVGILKPGIKFNQSIEDVGDLYIQTDVPFAYLYYGMEKNSSFVGLDITVGWESSFGLTIELGGNILFSPNDKIFGESLNGFTGMSFTVSYETDSFYTEIASTFPIKNLDNGEPYSYFDVSATSGISITPLFSYNFTDFLSAYVFCTFDGIGIKGNDIGISPAIGVTFSF